MTKETYGYSKADYAKFKKYAWLMLLSFGLTYLFFFTDFGKLLPQFIPGLFHPVQSRLKSEAVLLRVRPYKCSFTKFFALL